MTRTTLAWFGALSIITSALLAIPASAQPIGITTILNPEGSRLFPHALVLPRHPGKPDLRWQTFNWNFLDTSAQEVPVRLYFYNTEDWTARLVLPELKKQIEKLIPIFNYKPTKRFSYLLFSSQREFQQANIFNITEGVQGITSTTEATMAIPYWGEMQSFRHVSTHELVHQFEVQKINNLAGSTYAAALTVFPLWFIEGMAEYYSLNGVDPETRFYIRDALLNPNPSESHMIPGLFEEGGLNFIQVYKIGQAKIDFFESEFGSGTAQKLLEAATKGSLTEAITFKEVTSKTLNQTPEGLEQKWKDYINKKYKLETDMLSQSLKDFEIVSEAGENLDSFSLSPNGSILAIREIDPLSGVASISLIDLLDKTRRLEVIHDQQPGALSLYFLQTSTYALSDNWIAYIVATVSGPELELRQITRANNSELSLSSRSRIKLHAFGLTQASAPALSPDAKKLAFVGLTSQGKQNIYIVGIDELFRNHSKPQLRAVADEHYSWRNLFWTEDGILVSSDKTTQGKYNIFKISPDTGEFKQITHAFFDQYLPDGTSNNFVFQSWSSGTPQIHLYLHGQEKQLTEVKTGLISGQIRNGRLYALGFNGGRFHLYKIRSDQLLRKPVNQQLTEPDFKTSLPWKPVLETIPPDAVRRYHAFTSPDSTRLDYLAGFLSTGSFVGISGAVSDLMRDYSISADLTILGNIKFTDAALMINNSRGRTKRTFGVYHLAQQRMDNIFPPNGGFRTYIYREFGALGALQYPLGPFTYVDAELRLAGASRGDYNDPNLSSAWEEQNPGTELLLGPMFRFGLDRVIYELFTGPLKGYGLLAESDTSYFPARNAVTQRLRLDISYYLKLPGRTVLAFQGISSGTWGDRFKSPFLVSSEDILRAYILGDNRLFGNFLLATKTEFRFPIGSLFSFPPLRGLASYDLGSIFLDPGTLSRGITSSYSTGLSLNFPPIALNLIWSYPIRVAPGPIDRPVFHFSLRYLYL